MATKKKGILTKPREWAKHFRPGGKRQFWKSHRAAESRLLYKEKKQLPDNL